MALGGAMKGASSLSGRCHTFDIKADGYIKAEGVNAVILKRLSDAIRDGDPIRAVIRGSATNSDGRTPGIASPSSEAQATAIRAAYANAGISDLSGTTYLECHGTGTQVHRHRLYHPGRKCQLIVDLGWRSHRSWWSRFGFRCQSYVRRSAHHRLRKRFRDISHRRLQV